jgi:protein O-GlcNAc transferase
VNDKTQAISDKDWQKADFGLPDDGFVFCSFNHAYKIEPIMFDVWMNILRQFPRSVLWLAPTNKTARTNLRNEAIARKVESKRLIFAEKLPTKEDHLGRLRLAQLALDTRIFNGHSTNSDALWAGVPVITMQGAHFASRVTSSMLAAVGLPELITRTLDEYEKLAVHLACNQDELQTLRKKLERNRLSEPLFDTPRFARNLEKAYKKMWEIFLTGERARQIDVVEN